MKRILIFLFSYYLYSSATAGPGAVTIGYSANEIENGTGIEPITLSGTMTEQGLKLDHPIPFFSLTAKKEFESDALDLIDNDCKNCDENWTGSHVKIVGSPDEDTHNPLKAIFWVDSIEGQPQTLDGPLYDPYEDKVRLSGILSPVDCKGVTLVKMDLDHSMNVAKGGEFEGPVYGEKSVLLLCLDKRQGVLSGPATVEGYLDYSASDFDADSDCHFLFGMPMEVTQVTGVRNKWGHFVGLREILVRSEWKGLPKQTQDDRESEMDRSLGKLRDWADDNRIFIVDNGDMDVAYRFVDDEKTQEIKNIQPKADLKVLAQRFYGLK